VLVGCFSLLRGLLVQKDPENGKGLYFVIAAELVGRLLVKNFLEEGRSGSWLIRIFANGGERYRLRGEGGVVVGCLETLFLMPVVELFLFVFVELRRSSVDGTA
jgi:hypothetical protein